MGLVSARDANEVRLCDFIHQIFQNWRSGDTGGSKNRSRQCRGFLPTPALAPIPSLYEVGCSQDKRSAVFVPL